MRIVLALTVAAALGSTPSLATDAGDVPGRPGARSSAGWAQPGSESTEAGTDAPTPAVRPRDGSGFGAESGTRPAPEPGERAVPRVPGLDPADRPAGSPDR